MLIKVSSLASFEIVVIGSSAPMGVAHRHEARRERATVSPWAALACASSEVATPARSVTANVHRSICFKFLRWLVPRKTGFAGVRMAYTVSLRRISRHASRSSLTARNLVVGPRQLRSRKSNGPTRNRTENLLIKSLTRAVSNRQRAPGPATSRHHHGNPTPEGRAIRPFPDKSHSLSPMLFARPKGQSDAKGKAEAAAEGPVPRIPQREAFVRFDDRYDHKRQDNEIGPSGDGKLQHRPDRAEPACDRRDETKQKTASESSSRRDHGN